MKQPPEVLALLTDAEQRAREITEACASIRRDWPHMLPRNAPAQRIGGGSRSAGVVADKSAPVVNASGVLTWLNDNGDGSDVDALTSIVSLRRQIVTALNGWSRVVIEDRPITSNAVPDGGSAPEMCVFLERHAQWMSGHEAANDCAEEIRDLSRRAHQVTHPTRREWITLGDCPLPWVDDDGNETRCGGTVRAWPRAEDRDGEVMARCRRCGEEAVVTWWEARMFDNAELKVWLTDADLVTFVHSAFGKVVTEATIRQWVRRKVLEPSGRDEKGRRLFHREAVVWALEIRDRRDRMGS